MDEDKRIKRLRMRSWRRGTKEMDLILGPFSDTRLDGLDDGLLGSFEALLDENDQDLYAWILAFSRGDKTMAPPHLQEILGVVTQEALGRIGPVDKI